ncbi:hypothetical protein ABPG72_009124 [Tetrahymena utriculariae]
MFTLHLQINPFTQESINKQLNADKRFRVCFNNVSNLARNSCFSPNCPFYQKKLPNLGEHINDIDYVIPAFSKTVKMMKGKDAELIYNAICKGSFLDNKNEETFIKQTQRLQSHRVQHELLYKLKDYYIKCIDVLKEHYKDIHNHNL